MTSSEERNRNATAGLPADHFRLSLTNAPLSPNAPFGDCEWEHHSTRAKDEAPGERILWLAPLPEGVEREREPLIAWAESKRYHAVIETEVVEFSNAFPHIYGPDPIVALGSSALFEGVRCMAAVGERMVLEHRHTRAFAYARVDGLNMFRHARILLLKTA